MDFSVTKIIYLLLPIMLLFGCVDEEILSPVNGGYRTQYGETIQQQTAQVRLTNHFFTFIEDEALSLLKQFAGDFLGDTSGDGDILPFCVTPLYGTQDINLLITTYSIAYGVCSNCISWDGTGCESTYNDCSDGENGCGLDLKMEEISLRPVDQNNTEIDAVRLSAKISINDQIAISADLSTAEGFTYCHVTLNGEASAQVDLDFTDQGSGEVGIGLGDLDINFSRFDLGGVSCFESGTDKPDSFMTTIVGLLLNVIGSTIQDQATAQIAESINPIIETMESDLLCSSCIPDQESNLIGGYHCPVSAPGGSSCQRCQFNTDCPEGFSCNPEGLCSIVVACSDEIPCETGNCDQNGHCIISPRCMVSEDNCFKQKLGIEGMLTIRDLLGTLYQNPGNSNVALYVNLGNQARADSNNGLTFSMMGGIYGESNQGVIPVTQTLKTIPEPDFLQENSDNGTPYHMGIALAEQFIDTALQQLYQSGAFNIDIDATLSDFIVTDTFSVFIPSISTLSPQNSSMMISIRPQTSPKIFFGTGALDGEGLPIIGDSLLNIEFIDLKLEFYAFVDNHYIKLFSVLADVYLNASLDVDGNQLTPVLPQIGAGEGKQLQNIRVIEGGILPEKSEDLENTLLSVVELALGFIPLGFEPMALPEVFNYSVQISDVTMKKTNDTRFLAIYTKLVKIAAKKSHQTISLPDPTPIPYYTQGGKNGKWPSYTLDLKKKYSVRYRLNRGLWTPWQIKSKLFIQNKQLGFQGKHLLELQLKDQQQLYTVKKEIITDSIKPRLQLKRTGHKIIVSAQDSVSDQKDLRYEISIDGTSWQVLKTDHYDLTNSAQNNQEIRVAVTDQQGNRHEIKRRYTTTIPDVPEHPIESGCDYGGSKSSNDPFILLLTILLVIRFRKNMKKTVLFLFIILGMTGCFDNNATGGCVTKTDCPENQGCQNGSCTPCKDNPYSCSDCYIPTRCDQLYSPCHEGCQCNIDQGICYPIENFCHSRKDCNDGEICETNRCITQTIACGGACPGGSFCCGLTDQCTPLPEACGDFYCPSGYKITIVKEGTLDEATCNLQGTSCQCDELPPLAMGTLGKYTRLGIWKNQVIIGTYNETYGDLMLGIKDGDSIEWIFVDGIPEGEVLYGPNGPRGGISEPGDQVGTFLSMAVDADNQIHIAYYDRTNQNLKYTRMIKNETQWEIKTMIVDSTGDSGYDPAIILNSDQIPVILYGRYQYQDNAKFYSSLNLASAVQKDPLLPEQWEITELIRKERFFPCKSSCNDDETCIIDPILTAQCSSDLLPVNEVFQNTTPVQLPEKGEIVSTISITERNPIAEVYLSVNITHPKSGEFSLELISPDGHSRVVKNQNNQYQTENFIITDVPVFTEIQGEMDGIWKLKMIDHYPSSSGTLNHWSLSFKQYRDPSPYCNTRCVVPDNSCGDSCETTCSEKSCYESIIKPTYRHYDILVGTENHIAYNNNRYHIFFNNPLQKRLSYLTVNPINHQITEYIDLVRGKQVIETGWIHRDASIHFFYLQNSNELKHLLYQKDSPLISTLIDDGIRLDQGQISINRIGGSMFPMDIDHTITLFYSDDSGHNIFKKEFDQGGWLNDPEIVLSATTQQQFGFFLQGILEQTKPLLSTFFYNISTDENSSGLKFLTPAR